MDQTPYGVSPCRGRLQAQGVRRTGALTALTSVPSSDSLRDRPVLSQARDGSRGPDEGAPFGKGHTGQHQGSWESPSKVEIRDKAWECWSNNPACHGGGLGSVPKGAVLVGVCVPRLAPLVGRPASLCFRGSGGGLVVNRLLQKLVLGSIGDGFSVGLGRCTSIVTTGKASQKTRHSDDGRAARLL